MPRILGLLPSALIAARSGATASEYYASLRAVGAAPRSSEAHRLFGIAKNIVSRSADEPFRPLNQAPSGSDLAMWPSKGATGIAQTVSLVYRDKVTGVMNQTWWRTVTPSGIAREEAIAAAIDAYADHAERYGQDLVGAAHTSAYVLVPGLIQ